MYSLVSINVTTKNTDQKENIVWIRLHHQVVSHDLHAGLVLPVLHIHRWTAVATSHPGMEKHETATIVTKSSLHCLILASAIGFCIVLYF